MYGLGSSGSEQRIVHGSCEIDNEALISSKGGNLLALQRLSESEIPCSVKIHILNSAEFRINSVRILYLEAYINYHENRNALMYLTVFCLQTPTQNDPREYGCCNKRRELYLVLCRLADSLQAWFTTMWPSSRLLMALQRAVIRSTW